MSINIAGLTPVDDPSYRYKMPRIVPKVEGRGNGIKTVLINITDVAASLNRDPSEVTKFFGCELGAQTTVSVEEDRYIVNGAHAANDLQNMLCKYIESFVLCKNCRLPETVYKTKGSIISQKCFACGSKEPCDMTHKLTTFILKQHNKKKKDEESSKKKEKKEKKEKKSRDEGKEGDDGDAEESSREKKKEKKEKKKKKKKREEEDNVADEGENETDSDAVDAAVEQFRIWLTTNLRASSAAAGAAVDAGETESLLSSTLEIAPSTVIEELRSTQVLASLRPVDRVLIFMGAVFTPQALARNEVAMHKAVLSALAPSAHQQRHLISGAEWFCGTRCTELSRKFPVLLKLLYDEDLVEEEVFYEWEEDRVRNEYSADESMISTETLESLKEAAAPFINWLREADEEESSGEDDDEEEA